MLYQTSSDLLMVFYVNSYMASLPAPTHYRSIIDVSQKTLNLIIRPHRLAVRTFSLTECWPMSRILQIIKMRLLWNAWQESVKTWIQFLHIPCSAIHFDDHPKLFFTHVTRYWWWSGRVMEGYCLRAKWLILCTHHRAYWVHLLVNTRLTNTCGNRLLILCLNIIIESQILPDSPW